MAIKRSPGCNCCGTTCNIASGGSQPLDAGDELQLFTVSNDSLLDGSNLINETVRGFPDSDGDSIGLVFRSGGTDTASFTIGIDVVRRYQPEDICVSVPEETFFDLIQYVDDGTKKVTYFRQTVTLSGDVPSWTTPIDFVFPDIKFRDGAVSFGTGLYDPKTEDGSLRYVSWVPYSYDLDGNAAFITTGTDTDIGSWSYDRLQASDKCSGSSSNGDCLPDYTCETVAPHTHIQYQTSISGLAWSETDVSDRFDGCSNSHASGDYLGTGDLPTFLTTIQYKATRRRFTDDGTNNIYVTTGDTSGTKPYEMPWTFPQNGTAETEATVDVVDEDENQTTSIDFRSSFFTTITGDRVKNVTTDVVGAYGVWEQTGPQAFPAPWKFVKQMEIPTLASLPDFTQSNQFKNVMQEADQPYYFIHSGSYYEWTEGSSSYTLLMSPPSWTKPDQEYGMAANLRVRGLWAAGLPVSSTTVTENVNYGARVSYCPSPCDDIPPDLPYVPGLGAAFGPELNAGGMVRDEINQTPSQHNAGQSPRDPFSYCGTNPTFIPDDTEPWAGDATSVTGSSTSPDPSMPNQAEVESSLSWWTIKAETLMRSFTFIDETVEYKRKWASCWSAPQNGPTHTWTGSDLVYTPSDIGILESIDITPTGGTASPNDPNSGTFLLQNVNTTFDVTYGVRAHDLSVLSITAAPLGSF